MAIVITHVCPFPTTHGNRRRILDVLAWLKRWQFRIILVLQPADVDDPALIARLNEHVDEVVVTSPPKNTPPILQRLAGRLGALARGPGRPDPMEIMCWPDTLRAVRTLARVRRPLVVISEYAFFGQCLTAVPRPALRVIDAIEVFSRPLPSGREQPAGAFSASVSAEAKALGRADTIIAIHENDAAAIRQLVPGKKVVVAGYGYRGLDRAATPNRGEILYVASSNPHNREGLEAFLVNAFGAIREAFPTATLQIVGDVSRGISETAGVSCLGRLDDQQLAGMYQRSHVVINPQMTGTGLKFKCVEALGAGCPLVTTSAGADGIETGAGDAFLVADRWSEFAACVLRVLRDDALRLRLEERAREFARRELGGFAAFPHPSSLIE